jgi:hypothetical protein
VAELRFRLGSIFPADNPTARYVMAVSIALGDLRTAAEQASREDAPEYERLYFARLLDLHVREGLRLAVLEHRERDDVRRFVSILPDEAQEARNDLERTLTEVSAGDLDLGPNRGDTFSCSRMIGDSDRLEDAMARLAEVESAYRLVGEGKRADFADLVAADLSLGAEGRIQETAALVARIQQRVAPVFEPLLTYLEHVEAAWLRPWRG